MPMPELLPHWALWMKLVEREGLSRYVVQPDHSGAPGPGHWLYSSAIVEGTRSPLPSTQRVQIALVVECAPRAPVAASVSK
jgi:hypothetical protein